ncbi:MAG: hypothetical protein FWE45_05360 [Firmicutes bacterium]|nr:hypothetical protein [Bacillota bacterium]
MKKLMLISLITLSVGIVLVLTAGILRSITFDLTTFNPTTLNNAFTTVGYLIAVLSGVVFTGLVIVSVIKAGGESKKAILFSAVAAAVGLTLVLVAAVLGTIPATTWGTGTGTFNPNNGLMAAFNTIGYLVFTLSGVMLVALTVAGVVKKEAGSK